MMKQKKLAKRRHYAVQIKDVIPRIAKNINNGKDIINLSLNWNRIIGNEFAKYITPVKIQTQNNHKILWLRCANGASMTMNYAQMEIIERINLYLGNKKINNIRWLPENKKTMETNAVKQSSKPNNQDKAFCQKALQNLAESL